MVAAFDDKTSRTGGIGDGSVSLQNKKGGSGDCTYEKKMEAFFNNCINNADTKKKDNLFSSNVKMTLTRQNSMDQRNS